MQKDLFQRCRMERQLANLERYPQQDMNHLYVVIQTTLFLVPVVFEVMRYTYGLIGLHGLGCWIINQVFCCLCWSCLGLLYMTQIYNVVLYNVFTFISSFIYAVGYFSRSSAIFVAKFILHNELI
jgi:hypothetical protein